MAALGKEKDLQDELKDLIKNVASKYRLSGLEIADVKRDHPVDRQSVDIVIFLRGFAPFLFIETKWKGKKASRQESIYNPLGAAVIGQVLSYAALYKRNFGQLPSYCMTTNEEYFVIFRTPEKIYEFVDLEKAEERDYENAIKRGKYAELLENYVLIQGELKLTSEYIYDILDKLSKDLIAREPLSRIEPSLVLIQYFRTFVYALAKKIQPLVKLKMHEDNKLASSLKTLRSESGFSPTPDGLALMMSYVLMDKIIFYKVLEQAYKLPKMSHLNTRSSTSFDDEFLNLVEEATRVTRDFEPIFFTGPYDLIPIPDDPSVMDYINDFIATVNQVNIMAIADLIGYIYEELLPPEERHLLGQFYTPSPVAELIIKWSIKGHEDKVLDPGVGSGTFLAQAYKAILTHKTGSDKIPTSKEIHERILNALYAIDVNPFPVHLTAMTLAMKNVLAPFAGMNLMVNNFFRLEPGATYLSPYRIKTPAGEQRREIAIPTFDCVVGNPPYTRWDEIDDDTKTVILRKLGPIIKGYGLLPAGGLKQGQNPGIYIYWVMHASKFLAVGDTVWAAFWTCIIWPPFLSCTLRERHRLPNAGAASGIWTRVTSVAG